MDTTHTPPSDELEARNKRVFPSYTPDQHLRVQNSRIHMSGVFAKKRVPRGVTLLEYKGELITKEESARRLDADDNPGSCGEGAVYIFELNKTHDIDGDTPDNPAKYINHSCQPNCKFVIKKDKVWVVSTRAIKEGDELTINYGYSFDEDLDELEDFKCLCGKPQCVGYMISEDDRPKLQEFLKRQKRRGARA